MKKQILNLGKRLSREDQQEIKGGFPFIDCDQFCNISGNNPEFYLQDQLKYGLDWSHCVC
ncbi:hypothetical protein C7447_101515 [Tenacibaculum adriaticum]|uniref:Uncharacterized protein n=1 Tax=Tenacibaculum adriaticum TaxID=413713 RepID=A0A5S5DXC0_9FLAO|nr:hypothetical protein [Tenacibaculum adriaticum]TYP99908.1 hypothetical protein C7447_101515 [Tenacibaculum adriaticum]